MTEKKNMESVMSLKNEATTGYTSLLAGWVQYNA